MSPVGIVLVLLGLAAAFQIATRGPALLAAAVAVVVLAVLQGLNQRARRALAEVDVRGRDPAVRSTRAELRLLRRAAARALALNAMGSMFPQQSAQGARLAGRLGFA